MCIFKKDKNKNKNKSKTKNKPKKSVVIKWPTDGGPSDADYEKTKLVPNNKKYPSAFEDDTSMTP